MTISHQINPEADITYWNALGGGYVVATCDGAIIANCTRAGLNLLIAGASDAGRSVYHHDDQQFICGTLDQLTT